MYLTYSTGHCKFLQFVTLQISSIRDIANVFELFSYAWIENCLIQTDQETDNIN